MFDFAWSEIALVGVVALIAIGPKDMPVAIRTVAKGLKKARAMAAEFQTHVDEMVRDAELGEVRDQFNNLRGMSVTRMLDRTIDKDGSLSRSLDDPGVAASAKPAAQPERAVNLVDIRPASAIVRPPDFDRNWRR